jgi:predicted HTH transcriptional regulator
LCVGVLRNQAAVTHFIECENSAGNPDQVLLVYVPYTENHICETLTSPPKAWRRVGKQNTLIDDLMREQLKRDKRIVNFERTYCCPFHIDEVDKDVLREFRQVFLADAIHDDYDDEQILHQAGAIDRDGDGYVFTNAGFLFFAARPQRLLDWAYIRLLRFEVNSSAANSRGLYTFERRFDGPIPQQIRKIRTFFRDSGFFKTYQKRKPEGGFVDDPEFPHIAVDEAIVNAVAHRDYGIQLPIECVHYKDAFVVENPGRILQRGYDLPSEFSLAEVTLDSMPRNSKLMEWLNRMREDGAAFVRAIGEGTRRMQQEMDEAGLPAPLYRTNHSRTVITLYNNVSEREALHKAASVLWTSTQFANLFPIRLLTTEGEEIEPEVLRERRKDFLAFLQDALQANGWYIDRFGYGRITAHRKKTEINLPKQVEAFIGFYPAYAMQLREYWGQLYLCIDYTLEVKSKKKANELLRYLDAGSLKGRIAIAKLDDWQRGKIKKVDDEWTYIYLFDLRREERIASDKVIPDLPIELIKQMLNAGNVRFDLSREMKRHSLALEPGAAPTRAEKTITIVQQIAETIFPLQVNELEAILLASPEPLYHDGEEGTLTVQTLKEPSVEFKRHRASPDIREGITSFGAYEEADKELELVPICTDEMRESMAALIERLKAGKYKYLGSERTFSTRLGYGSIITVRSPEDILKESERLLDEHPDWGGNENLDRLFLVHTPEAGYSIDDENSPYYRVKRFLLEQGIPCQMVDTPTLLNPDWKDLNLALNIVAKTGVTPWVLPDSIPDADFFVGLSYTQSRKRGSERLVGYATVFNQFGHWQFYLGNTEAFSYEERVRYFALLTKQTLERLTLSGSPSIYFHYSARFSREDRESILRAARNVRANGTYSFVSINSHHNIRLYDSRAETDGSLSRGSYVGIGPSQILISTTGYNPYRKALGTPKPLEVTIWTERPEGVPYTEPDLKSLAAQILSLTKLNWASTDSLCGEPITTKYAGDIAYLTDAFLRQTGTFRLHPVLENTPWFI